MTMLLTGATGFFGKQLLTKIASEHKEIYVLVREKSLHKIEHILKLHDHIIPVFGDITEPDVISNSEIAKSLKNKIKTIVHAAAYYNIESDDSACFINNVMGTQNILYFASECNMLSSFHHVSTIAVSGNYKGEFPTSEIDLGQKFDNAYASSKFESEKLVRRFFEKYKSKLSVLIYRPGVIIGDSITGEMEKIDGPYYFLNLLAKIPKRLINEKASKLTILPFPLNNEARMPLIPVDHAVSFLNTSLSRDVSVGKLACYHLVSIDYPKVKTLVLKSLKLYNLSPRLIPIPYFKVYNPIVDKIGLPKELLSYMYSQTLYDLTDTIKEFPELKDSCFEKYQVPFFKYGFEMFSDK